MNKFLPNRYQRNLLNGQIYKCNPVTTRVPYSSIFGPHVFLIYINGLSSGTSWQGFSRHFSVLWDVHTSASYLNKKLINGTINGKWKSIPVLLNSARKSISVFKLRKKNSELIFNENELVQIMSQKSWYVLDYKLSFDDHLKYNVSKIKNLI